MISGPMLIEPSPHRFGFYRLLRVPKDFEPVLRNTLGAKQSAGVWVCPGDAVKEVYSRSKDFAQLLEQDPQPLPSSPPDSRLYKYQAEGSDRALAQLRLLIGYKPGTGKTPTTIDALKRAGARDVLVTCPAIVRQTWLDEITSWWPDHPQVKIIEASSDLVKYKVGESNKGEIVVTSYEIAERNASFLGLDWDAFVGDESHYLKDGKSKRSKGVRLILSELRSDALRLFLSGTPIADTLPDLHNQVDLLYPELWGSRYDFLRRYCLSRENPYASSGLEFYGVNPAHADELKERLAYVSVSATEDEIKGLLPPITFQAIRVKPNRSFNLREYLDNFNRRDVHRGDASGAILACGREKVGRVVELVEDGLSSGSTHISVMTHQRITAIEIASALQGLGLPIGCITGADDHKKRHSEIARLAKEKRAVFVGTMHSIGIGINELVAFPDVIFAELDYRPDEVVQAMKRYHRVSGKANVRIRVLVLEGTLEEKVALAVARKLKDQEMVSDPGSMARSLEGELNPTMDDATFFEMVQAAAARMVEGKDEYE